MPTITSINPYDGSTILKIETIKDDEVVDLLEKSQTCFTEWKTTSFSERSKLLKGIAVILRNNKEEYAKTITLEMGKPITQAIAEIEKCAWVCDYYAQSADKHLASSSVVSNASKSYITYEPLGVILAIMPWNYPFWQVFRFAAPALMAGNVVVLKHASNVFGSAKLIEDIFIKAQLPQGVFRSLPIQSEQIEAIIANPIIKAVTLTGSERAGSSVAALAGKYIKKTVLELGGSNALIIFDDADLEMAAEICVHARFQNTGQSCIAGKRLLLASSIADEFLEKLTSKVKKLKSGNPVNNDVFIGVLAKENLAVKLEKQLEEALKLGAKIVLGGNRTGTYFEPTIVSNITPEMAVFKEETFGPLLAVSSFTTEIEALKMSNRSNFGLGVSLFSKDIKRMESYVSKLEEGAVFINSLVKSDPRLPFGGIKSSGYGRELGEEGIRAFVNIKTVFIS